MTVNELQVITYHIRHDDLTLEDLRTIVETVNQRRKLLGANAYDDFKIGDHVAITGAGTGAKYLNGCTGVISKKLYVKLEVTMDAGQATGRFGKIIRVPPSMLRPID